MTFTATDYAAIRAGAQASAAAVVPYVHELVAPTIVLDVGGGEGWWARAFAELGCHAVLLDETVSIETSERVGAGVLSRRYADLANGDAWASDKVEADLVVCLEVAEHLPEAAAPAFIATLCALAPVVLFSAAIPGQRGLGHVNEQWPSYWADLFYASGLVATEALRREFWGHVAVEPWYRQNMLLFARHEWMDAHGLESTRWPRDVVHPAIYAARVADLDDLRVRVEDHVERGIIHRPSFYGYAE